MFLDALRVGEWRGLRSYPIEVGVNRNQALRRGRLLRAEHVRGDRDSGGDRRRLAFERNLDGHGERRRPPVDGDVPDHLEPARARGANLGGGEGDSRMVGDVEEIVRTKVVVTLGDLGVDGRGSMTTSPLTRPSPSTSPSPRTAWRDPFTGMIRMARVRKPTDVRSGFNFHVPTKSARFGLSLVVIV
ncbi:MAG: hypothetical protein ABSB09_05455 [Acidimicrobiales bacterium]